MSHDNTAILPADLATLQARERREEIRLALCDLRDAAERLRLAGCPYARLAVQHAIKSTAGALRHADRGLPPSSRKVRRPRRPDRSSVLQHAAQIAIEDCTDAGERIAAKIQKLLR